MSGKLGKGCIIIGLLTKLEKDLPVDIIDMRFFFDGGVFMTIVTAGGEDFEGLFVGDLALLGVVMICAMAAIISTAAFVGVLAGGVTTTGGEA